MYGITSRTIDTASGTSRMCFFKRLQETDYDSAIKMPLKI